MKKALFLYEEQNYGKGDYGCATLTERVAFSIVCQDDKRKDIMGCSLNLKRWTV